MTLAENDSFARRTGIGPDDLRLLGRLPLFSGLAPEALRALLADSAVPRVARGTVLFLQGEPATRFYAVREGWLKLFRETRDGQESGLGVFRSGESFAEAAMFASKVFPVSAAAVEAGGRRHCGPSVCATRFPRSGGLAGAPSHGLPVVAYDRRSAGADAYWKVAMELVERA